MRNQSAPNNITNFQVTVQSATAQLAANELEQLGISLFAAGKL